MWSSQHVLRLYSALHCREGLNPFKCKYSASKARTTRYISCFIIRDRRSLDGDRVEAKRDTKKGLDDDDGRSRADTIVPVGDLDTRDTSNLIDV